MRSNNAERKSFVSLGNRLSRLWLLLRIQLRSSGKARVLLTGLCGLVGFLLCYFVYATFLVRHSHLLRNGRCDVTPSEQRNNIAIVTLYETQRFEKIGMLGTNNKKEYARRHNYTVFVDNHLIDMTQRRPSWMKVSAVRSHLNPHQTKDEPKFDWVMWMDADALFMNFDVRLESVLDDRYDIIITRDRNGVNAGVWFIKNSDWSRNFLETWWDKTEWIRTPDNPRGPSGDQHALKALLEELNELEGSEEKRHVKYVPQCWFNSYPSFRWRFDGVYMTGDLVAHIAGFGLKDKERLFDAFANGYVYPYYNLFFGD